MQIACIFKHPNLTVESGLQLLFAAILSVPTRGCTIVQLCNGYSNSRMQHVDFTLHCIQTHYLTTSFFFFFVQIILVNCLHLLQFSATPYLLGPTTQQARFYVGPIIFLLLQIFFYQITLN